MNMENKHFDFKREIDAISTDVSRVEKEEIQTPYDQNRFTSFAALPKDVPNDVVYQLSDLFDGNEHLKPVEEKQIGPNSSDKIRNALAVVYIVEQGIPVAGATLVDPTLQNYKGIIPKDYYELKSGILLSGRILQEYFSVSKDRHNLGLAQELKSKLETLAPKMFVIANKNDKDTQYGLLKNGYTFISEFETDWEDVPVQLWIN